MIFMTTIFDDPATLSAAQLLSENWGELVLIGLSAVKAMLNLLPSEKPAQVFSYLDSLINFLITDKLRKRKER